MITTPEAPSSSPSHCTGRSFSPSTGHASAAVNSGLSVWISAIGAAGTRVIATCAVHSSTAFISTPATAQCSHTPRSTRHGRRSTTMAATSTKAQTHMRTATNSSGVR